MSDRISFGIGTLLAWAIAAWCIVSGIMGIMAWDSDSARFGRNVAEFFGKDSSPSALIIAILFIVSGALLLIASLGLLKPNLNMAVLVLVMAFFGVRGFLALFVERKAFSPNTLSWCKDAAFYLILILATWRTKRSTD